MPYIPHTPDDVARMLRSIGVPDVEALLEGVPQTLRRRTPLELPEGLDEVALAGRMEALSAGSRGATLSFLGAGAYDHAVHPVVDQLLARSEFLTPYTPYQPEASQGTLQAIFEFQTMIAELFGLDVANASLYDGASAAAEAALMARRLAKRERILLSAALPPQVRRTVRTYTRGAAPELVEEVPFDPATGAVDLARLAAKIGPDVGAVVLGYPNYFGVPEDLDAAAHLCCDAGAYLVSHTPDPTTLGILRSPGAANVAVAVGEGQPLGLPLSFGGPGVGLMAARSEFVRQLPGRLAGETVDNRGQRAFVLTLSTREQHIRREKATSNVCTNQGLCALGVTIHLSLVGPEGFRRVAETCHARARKLAAGLGGIPGVHLAFHAPYAHEFAIRHDRGRLDAAAATLQHDGILLGVPLGPDFPELGDARLLAVTERTRPEDIDRTVDALRRALA
ncbi:MAG: aminomethyl-transferring glycine dehydrogenase subunit GcvPA [Deltaproteobacteria bacterium]|nr:aminomethyl-transferring glycine dehydrogenase subunit GcvPA [Deltaproteobacteria bacterium]